LAKAAWEVWLAEQNRPIRRHVAVKLIKAGMDAAQVVARFGPSDGARRYDSPGDRPGV
jgi:hypothetical protein